MTLPELEPKRPLDTEAATPVYAEMLPAVTMTLPDEFVANDELTEAPMPVPVVEILPADWSTVTLPLWPAARTPSSEVPLPAVISPVTFTVTVLSALVLAVEALTPSDVEDVSPCVHKHRARLPYW